MRMTNLNSKALFPFMLLFILFTCLSGCGSSSLPNPPFSAQTSQVLASPKAGTAPLTVRFKFYPSSYIDPSINIWYMGDGAEFANKLEFAYTYARAGVFPVRLSLRNNFSKAKKYYQNSVVLPTICVYDNANPERYDYVKTISLASGKYFDDIAADSSGNIYVTGRRGDNYVYVFSNEGKYLTSWKIASNTDALKRYPFYKITIDTQDNIYIIDKSNNLVYRLDKDGKTIKQWGACNPSEEGDSCQNDNGRPFEITTDAYDNIYVMESTYSDSTFELEEWVMKFNSDGSYLSRVNLPRYSSPKIAIGPAGQIYSLMESSPYLREYSSSGELIKEWGSHGNFDGELKYPQDIKTDTQGNIFLTDLYSKRVSKFDANSGFVTKFGSCENDNLPDLEELELLKDGTVYVINSSLSKITVFKKRISKI